MKDQRNIAIQKIIKKRLPSFPYKLEEMLKVSIERLQDLNSRFGCRENSVAITKMQEALMWLEERTKDRIKRGVEGQHVA